MATTSVSNQQVTSADDHADETALQDDAVARPHLLKVLPVFPLW
ncbi:hypothetical protein OROHE_004789 [Orobanche hederae]